MGVIIKFVVNAAKVDLSDVTENARDIRTPPQESVPLLVLLVLQTISAASPENRWRPAKRGPYLGIDDKITIDKTNDKNKAYQNLAILKLRNFELLVRSPI